MDKYDMVGVWSIETKADNLIKTHTGKMRLFKIDEHDVVEVANWLGKWIVNPVKMTLTSQDGRLYIEEQKKIKYTVEKVEGNFCVLSEFGVKWKWNCIRVR